MCIRIVWLCGVPDNRFSYIYILVSYQADCEYGRLTSVCHTLYIAGGTPLSYIAGCRDKKLCLRLHACGKTMEAVPGATNLRCAVKLTHQRTPVQGVCWVNRQTAGTLVTTASSNDSDLAYSQPAHACNSPHAGCPASTMRQANYNYNHNVKVTRDNGAVVNGR